MTQDIQIQNLDPFVQLKYCNIYELNLVITVGYCLFIVHRDIQTWEFSDEFDIVFAMNQRLIPNFKSHNIMSARVHFMKRVKDCKDVSIMSLPDEQ